MCCSYSMSFYIHLYSLKDPILTILSCIQAKLTEDQHFFLQFTDLC